MIGPTISHYKIVEKIGQGGMGIVYKALDLHLDRLAAIKVLPQESVTDPERKRRFILEAKSASALNHPNIVTIYDIDRVNGTYFIAMEYVAGKTLRQLIRTRELRLENIVSYGTQIADALSQAHAAGIVHRDIKPSNVMITRNNVVKVLDFGLAKLASRPGAGEGAEESASTVTVGDMTDEGMVLGTLSYMSPEQAQGRPVDHRTDIFSLGVMLYEMIAGELPFSGPHAAAVLDKLLHSPTPSLKSGFPALPDVLEQTIARATAKDPDKRYQKMQDMASDLRSLSGIKAPVPRRAPRRRWRFAIPAIILIILAVLLALPFRDRLPNWMGGTTLPGRIRLAVLPFINVSADSGNQPLCDGIMEALVSKFTQVEQFQDTLSIVASSEVRAEKVTSASQARRAFGANMVLTGSIQKFADKIVLTVNLVDTRNGQQIDAAICQASVNELISLENFTFEKASDMLALKLNPRERQALSAGETTISAAHNSYIQAIGYLARYDVVENVDKAVQLFQKAIADDPKYALAHSGLCEAYWRKYQRTKEPLWSDSALSNCTRALELESRAARVHTTLGIVYAGTGRPEKAVEELTQAIKMEPRSAEAYRELGRAYEAVHKFAEAEGTYRKGIELQPDAWSSYWNFGVFCYNRGRYDDAAAQFKKVIALAPDHFRAYASLGGIYVYQGKFAEGGEMLARSIAIKPSVAAYSNLSASYILQGRSAEAVPLLEKAIRMQGASFQVWGNLGDAYSQTRALSSKAPAAYQRAAELAREDLSVNPSNSEVRAMLAFYLVRLGEKKQAMEEIGRAGKAAQTDPQVLFWSALVYEWAGDRKSALTALAGAIDAGYSRAVIQAAWDLEKLRRDPRYLGLVKTRAVR